MRVLAVGILGAAVLAAGVLLVRTPRQSRVESVKGTHAGERQPSAISLETLARIRELGY